MKSYNYYKEILNNAGYQETSETVFCGVPSEIDFVDDKQHLIVLNIQPTNEYDTELNELEDGAEYTPDYDRMEVFAAMFFGPICNVPGYCDNGKECIILKDTDPIRYSIVDTVGGDDYQLYYPHKMDLFEKCVWIQNHIIEHEEIILSAHLQNLKRIRTEFDKVLAKLDFYQSYSSIFECRDTDFGGNYRDDSNLTVKYMHKCNELTICISTDCITGELRIDGRVYDAEDFEKYIIDNYLTKDGKIDVYYRYLFDSDYSFDTGAVYFDALAAYFNYKDGHGKLETLKSIDLSKLPAKDFQKLIDNINTEIKNVNN